MAADQENLYSIAVGLDGSDSSWKAFDEALKQAALKNAKLHIVSIQEEIEVSYSASEVLASEKTARENLEKIQTKARHEAKDAGLNVVTAIAVGQSSPAMVDYVKKNKINLLIVGDTGHSSFLGNLLGTTAEKIVRQAPCSVLIVR